MSVYETLSFCETVRIISAIDIGVKEKAANVQKIYLFTMGEAETSPHVLRATFSSCVSWMRRQYLVVVSLACVLRFQQCLQEETAKKAGDWGSGTELFLPAGFCIVATFI